MKKILLATVCLFSNLYPAIGSCETIGINRQSIKAVGSVQTPKVCTINSYGGEADLFFESRADVFDTIRFGINTNYPKITVAINYDSTNLEFSNGTQASVGSDVGFVLSDSFGMGDELLKDGVVYEFPSDTAPNVTMWGFSPHPESDFRENLNVEVTGTITISYKD